MPDLTSIDDIQREFDKDRQRPLVVFCTYQSSDEIEAAQKKSGLFFDLVIADEAHRCVTQSPDSLFSTVLDGTKIKAKRRLFMTATPRYMTARVKQKAEELNYDVVSMDDETKFGPEFY